jgi:hypothetical protein
MKAILTMEELNQLPTEDLREIVIEDCYNLPGGQLAWDTAQTRHEVEYYVGREELIEFTIEGQ